MKYGYSTQIKRVAKIPNPDELRQWCRDRISAMTPDVSNYAPGRYRLWLFHECNLKTGELTQSYFDERIYQFSQQIYPGCNIGLLTYGGKSGNTNSTGLINKHRDHTYAMPIARTVNLGNAVFGYGDDRHQYYPLNDGEVIEFNCKVLHSIPKITTPERFSLVFWKLNEAKGFKSLL
ncbi:MAG: hypothetical protein ACLFQP_00580 [Halothece sp.]